MTELFNITNLNTNLTIPNVEMMVKFNELAGYFHQFYHNYLMVIFVFIIIMYLYIDQKHYVMIIINKVFPESIKWGFRKSGYITRERMYLKILQMLCAILFVACANALFMKPYPSF